MLLLYERDLGNGWKKVKYKFDLLDNNGGNHIVYVGPKTIPIGIDTDADMLAIAPTLLISKAEQGQEELRENARNGDVVLHIDMGGYFEKILPDWDTWDNATTLWLKYWLSQEDQLELVNMQADNEQITNADKRNLLGITNQNVTSINSSVQIAVETKEVLDAYAPYFDEDGNWAGT